MDNFDYFSDLVFPAIVALISGIAAAYFSYKATYVLRKKSLVEEKELKIVDLAETLRLEIGKLTLVLEKLKEDVETFSYFSLKNIPIATASIGRLKNLQERVILFDDEELRREIIEITDNAASLTDDLYVMENYQVNEENRLRQVSFEAEKEFRQFKLNLLNLEIYIHDGKADYLEVIKAGIAKKVEKDHKLETINEIFRNLLSDIDRTALDKLKSDNEKKRMLLVTRILDVQTKLRSLISSLRNY